LSLEVLRGGMEVGGGMSSSSLFAHLGGGAFFGAGTPLPDEELPGPARSRMSLNRLAEKVTSSDFGGKFGADAMVSEGGDGIVGCCCLITFSAACSPCTFEIC
jgi:hypothetical protein